MDTDSNRLPIVEALIISSSEPLPPRKIADMFDDVTPAQVDEIVTALNDRYHNTDLSFRIRKIAGGYQMYVTENYAGYVDELYTRRRTTKLSRAALETLAIIAYRQPVTKGDIEMIRGVSSDSAIHTLLQRKLITLAGRAKSLGRPLLYATTDEFLVYFNLNSLEDLPRMEEIEELLAAVEPDNQQSLTLEDVKKVVLKKGEEKSENDEEEEFDESDEGEAEEDSDEVAEDETEETSEIPETLSEEEQMLADIIDNAVNETLSKNPEPAAESDEESDSDEAGEVVSDEEKTAIDAGESEEFETAEEETEPETEEQEETVER